MKVFNRAVKLAGNSRTINSVDVRVLEYDLDGMILRATGTSVPTGAGYSKGALFIKTDAASGTRGLYENRGTTASASFVLVGNSVTPSHYVVASGQFTTVGGDAAESATVSGVLATDIAIASIEDNGTNNVTLLQTAAASNAVNFTMSADPGNDALINYMVLRAVS